MHCVLSVVIAFSCRQRYKKPAVTPMHWLSVVNCTSYSDVVLKAVLSPCLPSCACGVICHLVSLARCIKVHLEYSLYSSAILQLNRLAAEAKQKTGLFVIRDFYFIVLLLPLWWINMIIIIKTITNLTASWRERFHLWSLFMIFPSQFSHNLPGLNCYFTCFMTTAHNV